MHRGLVAVAVLACALAGATAARASFILDRGGSGVTLRVSGTQAIVNWSARGARRHATLSGAINARQPNASLPQAAFRVVYGYGPLGGGSCGAYDGPVLPMLVAACKASDGSYWGIQTWQRLARNFGGASAPVELRVSHWSGDLPQLDVHLDWSYGGRFQHLFGRYTYLGKPVYGFHSTGGGNPLDAYGRNLYLDTLGSRYGSGWRRENSVLAHRGSGVFCYGFYPHGGAPGVGSRYRLTVDGPGVTPVVAWAGAALGGFDAALEQQMNDLQRSLGDNLCRKN